MRRRRRRRRRFFTECLQTLGPIVENLAARAPAGFVHTLAYNIMNAADDTASFRPYLLAGIDLFGMKKAKLFI
jgi:hypothetical protein